MKVYSIGRETSCDIVINDRTDVISRRHATLTISGHKMTITDQSCNGTYVNGIRISPNVPVPVTRKDNISFAHIASLDWNQVPKTGLLGIHYALIGVIAALLIGGIGGFFLMKGDEQPIPPTAEEIKAAVQDSIKKAEIKKDSIDKARLDSIKKAEKKSALPNNKKKETKKKADASRKKDSQPVNKKTESTAKPAGKTTGISKASRVGRPNQQAQKGNDSIVTR